MAADGRVRRGGRRHRAPAPRARGARRRGRAREDLAEARRALALDTGADLDAWLEEAATLERIHTELVATRKLAEKKSHVPERRFVVGLEMGERLSLERLGLQRYEQLADRRAEIEALRAELADERTRDEILADDLGSVELAQVELDAARELLARARGNDRLPARPSDVTGPFPRPTDTDAA
ncbi:MAG: hypothetical protein R2726_04660 [Acidimicrobiales bacterium]